MKRILCDNSEGTNFAKVLCSDSFRPDSFTIGERETSPPYLKYSERNFHNWCIFQIRAQLSMMKINQDLILSNQEKTIMLIMDNLKKLLDYDMGTTKVKFAIWNQEFIDILDNVIKFSLTGDIDTTIQTHQGFKDLANTIMPQVIEKFKNNLLKQEDYLKLSIISGISGLDLKGASAASSSFSQRGIPMASYSSMDPKDSIDLFHKEIMKKVKSPIPVFEWDLFLQKILQKKVKIVWFTDDYIETFFDLLFINEVLEKNINVTINIIPKRGEYGTDASWADVIAILTLCKKSLKTLNYLYKFGKRFSICKSGPSMGAINLRKLSNEVINEIDNSDFLVVKGCRAHEMIQGGLNKPTFNMYSVTREFSESITGFDASETPILFFYLAPCERAFFGFKERYLRTEILPGNRKLHLSKLTLKEMINNRLR